jgi:hypothetical protein
MGEHAVTIKAGGLAHWGRQVPLVGKELPLRVVAYECDALTSFIFGDGQRIHFRTLYIGIDEVDSKESISSGFGYFNMEEVQSRDRLSGRIKWRVDNGQDYGLFIFEGGTGAWTDARGEIDLRLDWCTRDAEQDFDSGDPVVLVGTLDGAGVLDLPSLYLTGEADVHGD